MDAASLFLGFIVGTTAAWLLLRTLCSTLKKENGDLKKELGMLRRELSETEQCGNGLERFTERHNAKKEAAKGKIVTALKAKGSLKNEEIAELAEISAATVVRYMDELEKEGKVAQEGRTGRSVTYRLNASGYG